MPFKPGNKAHQKHPAGYDPKKIVSLWVTYSLEDSQLLREACELETAAFLGRLPTDAEVRAWVRRHLDKTEPVQAAQEVIARIKEAAEADTMEALRLEAGVARFDFEEELITDTIKFEQPVTLVMSSQAPTELTTGTANSVPVKVSTILRQTKWCSRHDGGRGADRPVEEFGGDNYKADGLAVWCKSCKKAYNQSYYTKNDKQIKQRNTVNNRKRRTNQAQTKKS